jgi:colanic acid/amylovoran biosynthesis glycosyltransferase
MAKSTKSIVLFTRWFPYNKWKEISFLEDEMICLSNNYKLLTLVPQEIYGERYDLPEDVISDESLAAKFNRIGLKEKLAVVFSIHFIRELFNIGFNRNKRKYSVTALLSAIVIRNWILDSFSKEKQMVFYSFWVDYTTLGAVLAANKAPNWRVVSRCHNFDLYGNEENGYYVPYQALILKRLNAVYPDSLAGEEYIREKFMLNNVQAQIMGVSDPGYLNEGSKDGTFRAFSCSYMIQRKRVILIASGMILLAEKNPTNSFVWTHIGGGEEMKLIQDLVLKSPSNIKINLLGSLTNIELDNFYRNQPIDVFINVSEKEGTPVSLMESISFGIPVLVSGFGGNKEVANQGGGIVLTENPTAEEIAQELNKFRTSCNIDESKRMARDTWNKHYNSVRNYQVFSEKIDAL